MAAPSPAVDGREEEEGWFEQGGMRLTQAQGGNLSASVKLKRLVRHDEC